MKTNHEVVKLFSNKYDSFRAQPRSSYIFLSKTGVKSKPRSVDIILE